MMNLRGVLAEDVGAWWSKVEGWVAEALEHGPGLYAPGDVLHALERQEMQLWLACEGDEPVGCVTTSVERFPRKTVLLIGIVGGVGARRWIKPMDQLLADFAKAEGCDLQLAEGRPGWARFVGNGWKDMTMTFAREVER